MTGTRLKRSSRLPEHVLNSFYVLFGLLMFSLTVSAQSSIPICSDVFPAAITAPATPPNVLTLPPFPSPNDGNLDLRNNASVSLGPGPIHYTSINTGNNVEIQINGPTIIFVQGSAAFGNGNDINNPGNPADLVIIVYGTISIGQNTNVNGIIYSAGTVALGNNTAINGAVTAVGRSSTLPNTIVNYDPDAVANADFLGLCDGGQPPAPARLVAEYRMDSCEWTGEAGEAIDSGPNGLHGNTVNNPMISRDGVIGRAGFFDASKNQYIRVPRDPLLEMSAGNQVSVSMWIQQTSSQTGWITLLSKSDRSYTMQLRNGNVPRFTIHDGSFNGVDANASIELDRWHHLLGTFDGDTVRLYVNGVLQGENSGVGQMSDASDFDMAIAENLQNRNRHFHGLVDEVKIFDGPLTDAQVDSIHQNESAGLNWDGTVRVPVQCGLIFEARMEQDSWNGTPGEVLDTSGSDFHSTAEGSTSTAVVNPALPGNPGTCRYGEFDGENSGIFVGDAIDFGFGNELTVMAWVRWTIDPSDGNRWANIFSSNSTASAGNAGQFWLQHSEHNDRFEIAIQTDQMRRFQLSSTQPVQGQWYHVAGVYDGSASRLRIYVNGAPDGDRSIDGNSIASTAAGVQSHIGRWTHTPGNARRFTGNIDEVRLFDTALDVDEINEWMNTTAPCDIDTQIDHLRLLHPPAGLTCSPTDITIQACVDPNCSELFAGPVEASFTSPSGNWRPNPVSFESSASVALQYTEPGRVRLDATAIEPVADNPTRCFVGGGETDCGMEFLESGFILDIPDHVADVQVQGQIAAVRADPTNPVQCVPGFDHETRDIGFWSNSVNPASGNVAVMINDTAIVRSSPGTGIPIRFDGDGVGSFNLRYPDVGEIMLQARYEGSGDEAGLIMQGQTNFISRPNHFVVEALGNPAASGAGGPVFTRAGAEFTVEVSARNASGAITPNFGQEQAPEGVSVSHALTAPVGGEPGALSGSFDDFGRDCRGNPAPGIACGRFTWSEVGIITLSPRLASGRYLGTEDVVGEVSDDIGRFIPDRFLLSNGELVNRAAMTGCTDTFTYVGERFEARFTLTAQSALGNTTANHEGGFAFLSGSDLNLSGDPSPDFTAPVVNWIMGSADLSMPMELPRNGPSGPYREYRVLTAPVDADGVRLPDPPGEIGSTDLYFGRLVIDNAVGSELGPLDLPWRVEVWEDSTWRVNAADTCTAMDPADHIMLQNDHGTNVSGLDPIAVEVGGATTAIEVPESILSAVGGRGHLRLSAPMAPGWVEVMLGLDNGWHFLRDDLSDNGSFDENPKARASWGLFDGSPNRILLREVMPR